MKLSVTVLGPKDTAPAHDETEENEDDAVGSDLQSMVLLPPSIKTQDYMLEVNCFKAEGLPKLDAGRMYFSFLFFFNFKKRNKKIIKDN